MARQPGLSKTVTTLRGGRGGPSCRLCTGPSGGSWAASSVDWRSQQGRALTANPANSPLAVIRLDDAGLLALAADGPGKTRGPVTGSLEAVQSWRPKLAGAANRSRCGALQDWTQSFTVRGPNGDCRDHRSFDGRSLDRALHLSAVTLPSLAGPPGLDDPCAKGDRQPATRCEPAPAEEAALQAPAPQANHLKSEALQRAASRSRQRSSTS
jgi:hypothetical protein